MQTISVRREGDRERKKKERKEKTEKMGNVGWENNGLDESMEAFTRNNLLIKRGGVLCFALKSKCFFTVRKTRWKKKIVC